MIERDIQASLLHTSSQYPVLVLTGPRQSGKTTLVKTLFPKKHYVSLEDLDEREFAINDPRGFLNRSPTGLIIDEVQHVPALFSYIQTRVDENQKNAEYILTGSQNFLLLEKVAQSLAGRADITHLLPLSLNELKNANISLENPFKLIMEGFYPRLYKAPLDIVKWQSNYVRTYIERDVRAVKNIMDLSKFQLCLKLCAGRIGQLLNMSSLANECGVDQTTIKSWISIMESSFIIYLLRPHHKNFNKRLVKQPKLYFYDTGLAAYLLGINSAETLFTHYAKGGLFENFIISDLIKQYYNLGKEPALYFWRDHQGNEIDLLIEHKDQLIPIEIKSGETITQEAFKGIKYWQQLSGNKTAYVIYAGDQNQQRTVARVLSWKNFGKLGQKIIQDEF
jgi:predicted AAA+ superfamily ATPase